MVPESVPRAATLATRAGSWDLWMRTDVGLVRRRMEDAWVVLPDARLGGKAGCAWGVFDGLGGLPHGAEASWAAANHLREALAAATGPEDLLQRLNPHVALTRGATTGVIVWAERGADALTLIGVGDSAAYRLDGEKDPVLLLEKDSEGAYVVTDFLGNPFLSGHVAQVSLPRGATLFLCTDGVDGVVKPAAFKALARAPDPAKALEALFEEIRKAGAPDNATAILARLNAPA